MSAVLFRLNLTASSMPLLTRHYGASVAGRGRLDTDYVITNQYSGSQADAFIGIPTCIYQHNVLPYTHGVKSVGYKKVHGGFKGNFDFDSVFTLRSATGVALFSPAKGLNYVNTGYSWQSTPAPHRMAGQVTVAYLKEVSYVCYQGNGIYRLNSAISQFQAIQLAGLNTSSLRGITAANSYLIAFDDDTVYYSDPTNELNFQPTIGSGAGAESVLQVKGKIIACLPIENGFFIYTTVNVVAATYSGDVRYPWVYREIDGSAGITDSSHVAWTSNYSGHYAWTAAGLQFLTPEKATLVSPEVTDFLLAGEVEEYVGELGLYPANTAPNSAAGPYGEYITEYLGKNHFVSNKLSPGQKMQVKLALVASRFLCISYGQLELTNILVQDLALQRWGKLKIKHTQVLDYPFGEEVSLNKVAVVNKSGAVFLLCPPTQATEPLDSVYISGRIQAQRGLNCEVLGVQASTVSSGKAFVLPSRNGMSLDPAEELYPVDVSQEQVTFATSVYCANFLLAIIGDFELNSVTCKVNTARSGI